MSEDLEKLSIAELEQRLDAQRKTCIGLLQEMGRNYQRNPDASSVLFVRLNTLIDMMLSDEGRLIYEIRAEEAMENMMRLAMSELRQQQLTSPLTPKGPGGVGLFVPGT